MAKEKKKLVPDYEVVLLDATDWAEDTETYEDSKGKTKSRTIVTWLNSNGTYQAASGKIHKIGGKTVLRVTHWKEA